MTRTPLFLSDLCCCERLALWSIRCLVSRYRLPYCHETRTTDGMFPASFRPVLDAAERAFEDAAQHLREAGQPVLDINPPGSQGLSAMEERFLQGIQTVQNDGQKEVFHLLADLFPERLMQGYIVTALALISDCMAGIGHWLRGMSARRQGPELCHLWHDGKRFIRLKCGCFGHGISPRPGREALCTEFC